MGNNYYLSRMDSYSQCMMGRRQVSIHTNGDRKARVLSIDGQSMPYGNIEVREYENDEWVGGQYFKTYEEATEHIARYLGHTLEEDLDDERD